MSHAQLPARILFLPVSTGAVTYCGAYSAVNLRELSYVEMELVKFGARAGSERARLNVYSAANMGALLYSSSWRPLSDCTGIDDETAWNGRVRFDFARQNVNENNALHIGLELDNYTRNATTFVVGARLDYDDPVAATPPAGLAMIARAWFYGWGES